MRGREVITYYLFMSTVISWCFFYSSSPSSQDLDNLKFSIINGGKKKVVYFYLFFITDVGIEDSYDCEKLFYNTFMRKMPL